ncbi:MAG: hypothetical protein AB7G47_07980 [Mycolicibacterium sp.]|uniref:hypothetical protein n=1 Tax=Mycolicibacterium sp. TaxID=2320850 RepID=UPI003D125795
MKMHEEPTGPDLFGGLERALLIAGAIVIAMSFVYSFFRSDIALVDTIVTDWIHQALMVTGAALCFVGAARNPRERWAWWLFGVGLASYAAGDIVWALVFADIQPAPQTSISDVLWLLWYPCAIAGLVALLRARVRHIAVPEIVDGVVLGVVIATAALIFVFFPVIAEAHAPSLAVAVSLSYPIGDILLIGSVVAVVSILGWRPGWSWSLLSIGLIVNGVADVLYTLQVIHGTYADGTWIHTLPPLAAWLIGWASLIAAPLVETKHDPTGWGNTVVPIAIFVVAICIEVASILHLYHQEFTTTVKLLVIVALALGIVRTVLVPLTQRNAPEHDS